MEFDGTNIPFPPEYLLVVMAPPSRSEGRGLPREMVQTGVEATAEGYLHAAQDRELRADGAEATAHHPVDIPDDDDAKESAVVPEVDDEEVEDEEEDEAEE